MSQRKVDDSVWGRLKRGLCPRCDEKGPHFVPASCGDPGFYWCTEDLVVVGGVVEVRAKAQA